MTGQYAIADRISPSLTGSHAFCMLNRHTLGVVTQARTRHGYLGEILPNTQHTRARNCAEPQTREHIIFECQTHEEHRNIINKGAPDHQLSMPLRTILAKFSIKARRSKNKRPEQTHRSYQLQGRTTRKPGEQRNMAVLLIDLCTTPLQPIPSHQKRRPQGEQMKACPPLHIHNQAANPRHHTGKPYCR